MVLTVAVELIGPTEAKTLLEGNVHNRKYSPAITQRLVRDMTEGHWIENAETVQVSATGVLLNGQHRLRAIVITGLTLPFVVARDVLDEAQETIDIGRKRTLGDVLHLRGVQNARTLASVVRRTYELDVMRMLESGGGSATVQQLLQYSDDHPGIPEALPVAQSATDSPLRYTPSIAGALWYMQTTIDPDAANEFWSRLLGGHGLSADNPLLALRNRLVQDVSAKPRRMPVHVRGAYTIKGWNAWRAGEKAKRIVWDPAHEKYPVLAGLP